MKRVVITILATLAIATTYADYIIKIPLQADQGGSLPNDSINLTPTDTEAPSTPVMECLNYHSQQNPNSYFKVLHNSYDNTIPDNNTFHIKWNEALNPVDYQVVVTIENDLAYIVNGYLYFVGDYQGNGVSSTNTPFDIYTICRKSI